MTANDKEITIATYLSVVLCTLAVVGFIIVVLTNVNIIPKSQHNPVYLICDVYDIVYNGSTVEVDIILPNKELLTRQMSIESDLPEDFSEVVIETFDLDDYSTYKIVGMR